MSASEAIKRTAWNEPEAHPAAAKLPMMTNEELAALSEDIRINGLQHPIILLRDNTGEQFGESGPFPIFLLDGRNRLAAMKLAGISDPRRAKNGRIISETVRILNRFEKRSLMGGKTARDLWVEEVNPITFVLSVNVRRRHLSSSQKRDAIAAFIEADPTASDRKVAKELGVSDHTVASVRDQNSQIANSDNQPVERAKAAWLANPAATQQQIAKIAACANTTAGNARKKLYAQGLIPKPRPRGGNNKRGDIVTTASPKPTPNTFSRAAQIQKAIEKLVKQYGQDDVLAAIQSIFN